MEEVFEVFARLINVLDATKRHLMKDWMRDPDIAFPLRGIFEKILISKCLINDMFDLLCKYDVCLVKAKKKSWDEVAPKLIQIKNPQHQRKAFRELLNFLLEEHSWDNAKVFLDMIKKYDNRSYSEGLFHLADSLIGAEEFQEARLVIEKLKIYNNSPTIVCPPIVHYVKAMAKKNMFEEALQAVEWLGNNKGYKRSALKKISACLEPVKDQEKVKNFISRVEEIRKTL